MLRFFVKHPVAANLLLGVALLLGLWSSYKIKAQFLPDFDLSFVVVNVAWPNANTADVEQGLIIPLERELRDVSNVKKMQGIARDGLATIRLEFFEGTDMTLATEQTKSSVARAEPLPAGIEPPIISRQEQFEPIANVLLTGHLPFEKLKEIAYQYEADLLAVGIDKAVIRGIPEEEIRIEIPTKNLLQLNNSLPEISQAITASNPKGPVGHSGHNRNPQEIRIERSAETVSDFKQLNIRLDNRDENIRLADIADIKKQAKESEIKLFHNGMPAIELQLQRSAQGDALVMAEKLNRWFERQQKNKAPELEVKLYEEQWQLIAQRLALLIDNGTTGLLGILLVLFLFMHARLAFWIAFGIPVAILTTIAILYASGGSINMVSLFAMIMSLGIIVDDTIVVGENALTQFQRGKSPTNSVLSAARLMTKPVLASSLTTIAAFIPLFIVSGIIGQILSDIPFVIICVIIASLIECFLILPKHLEHSLAKGNNTLSPWREKFNARFNTFATSFKDKIIHPCVQQPFLPLGATAVLGALVIMLLATGQVAFTFFPTPDGNHIKLNATFFPGTQPEVVLDYLNKANDTLTQVDKKLEHLYGDKAITISTVVSGATADTQGNKTQNTGKTYGHINVELVDSDQRTVSNNDFSALWRSLIPASTAIEKLEITTIKGGPPGRDIDVRLSGLATPVLKEVSEDIQRFLKQQPGVKNVGDNLPYGMQSFNLAPTAHLLIPQLSLKAVSDQLQAGLSGQLIQRLQQGREEVEVRVSLPENERESSRLLEYYPIKSPLETMIPLPNLVTQQLTYSFQKLQHDQGELSVRVQAEVDAALNNANQLLNQVAAKLQVLQQDKPGLKFSFEGRREEQSETLSDMLVGLLIAFVLIYSILVFVFNSYLWPIVIMVLLPLSAVGAIIGHWLMGYDLTIMSMFGMFGLLGIVANDGIIIVNHFLQLHRKNDLAAALELTIRDRFRAVFLTSVTTIVGLTPLLFESSLQAQFLIPMAIAITFGLAFGFFLLLCLLPALVQLIAKAKAYWEREQFIDRMLVQLKGSLSKLKQHSG